MMMPPCILHQVSEHVWWFTPESRTDRASLGIVVGDKSALMLDIGASPDHTRQFLQALSGAAIRRPDYAMLTHWHWDHSFGISALDIPVIAHQDTAAHLRRIMAYDYSDSGLINLIKQGLEVEFCREHMVIEMTNAQRCDLKLRPPDIIFSKSISFELGGITCDIVHVGGDHAADSVVVYVPEDKVLFLGDCFYSTVYEEPRHYTKAKLLTLLDNLQQFDAEQYIEGHSNEIIDRAQMTAWFETFRQIFRLIDRHGLENMTAIRAALGEDNEDVMDFLDLVCAGY